MFKWTRGSIFEHMLWVIFLHYGGRAQTSNPIITYIWYLCQIITRDWHVEYFCKKKSFHFPLTLFKQNLQRVKSATFNIHWKHTFLLEKTHNNESETFVWQTFIAIDLSHELWTIYVSEREWVRSQLNGWKGKCRTKIFLRHE